MITKLACTCGRRFSIVGGPDITASISGLWQAEHRQCDAYYAALALVDWLEPEPGLDRAWKVGGVWYEELYAVLGALEDVRG